MHILPFAGHHGLLRPRTPDVTGGIVPASGHWIMEENPDATVKLITGFLAK